MKQAPPVGPTLVHVVRHGEVDNPRGVLYGRLPGFHLSANGLQMADRLGEYFAEVPLNRLVSSPLTRAQETIAPIAAGRDLEVVSDVRVVEAANYFEGQVFGRGYDALRKPRNWWLLRNPAVPSWGEPYKQVAARMLDAVRDAAHEVGEEGQALIVSHQLPIWMVRLAAEGRRLVHDPRKRQCTVGSVTTFHFRGDRITRVSYAEPCRDLLRQGYPGDAISSGSNSPVVGGPRGDHRLVRMNRRGLLGLVGGATLSTGLAACGSGTGVDLQSGFAVGNGSYTRIAPGRRDQAPVLTGKTLDGTPLSTADFPGKVLVINVWGSWCAPCRHEAPALQAVADQTKDVARFIGIDTRDLDVAPAKAFVRAFRITYPSLYDPSGALLLKFSQIPPAAIPSTLVIDALGGIAARVIGEVDKATLAGTITDVAGGK